MTPAPALRRPSAPARTRTPDRFLAAAVVVALVSRLPGLWQPLSPDEAGFLLVARSWSPTPESLYGPYFVDRPPVLLLVYRVAGAAGDLGPRLLAAALVVVLVVAVHGLAGRVATGLTVVLLANPSFSAWGAKGEVLGTPFALLGCLLALRAVERRSPALATCAGLSACLAAGVKQSLVGGLVFGVVLLGRRSPRLLGRFALGAGLPVLVGVAWVVLSPATLSVAWETVAGFRAEASAVLAASDSRAPVERAHGLLLLAVVSGLVPLLALGLASSGPRFRAPLPTAVLAMTAVDLAGVLLGGSYWHAYLVPLVPDVALLVALSTASTAPLTAPLFRAVAAVAVLSTLAAYPGFLIGADPVNTRAGEAIRAVAGRGDTVVTLYGSADLVLASGLPSPYRHLWSLPMRTLDPDQAELRRLLYGDRGPTWLVAVLPVDSWHVDVGGRLQAVLVERYRLVTLRCGPMVWLRRDVLRRTPQVEC